MRLAALLLCFLVPGPALAHAAEGGFVLLLPTGVYTAAGGAAVLGTLLVLAFARPHQVRALYRTVALPRLASARARGAAQGLGLVLLVLLIAAGFTGPHDPVENPLPLAVWTLLWTVMVVLQAWVFDLWRWASPFAALPALLPGPVLRLPGTGNWPALLLFLAFAGFLLADPAPADPPRLAAVCTGYLALTAAGVALFGRRWLIRGEFLTVVMRAYRLTQIAGPRRAGLPGWRLVRGPAPGAALAVLMIALLGAGSFDGLDGTFWWLAKLGVNPLEFPGRSAVEAPTLLGLFGLTAALVTAFAACIWLGLRLAGGGVGFARGFRHFAPAILPIAAGYHLAHYLTSFLVDIQYLRNAVYVALGLDEPHVTTGFFNTLADVRAIWLTQAGAVVAGHVLAILAADALALGLHGARGKATLSQLPLALFMIAYTVFGLWLLASPRGA